MTVGKHSEGAPAAVSFSSCGWLMLYNFGVAKALAESDLIDLSVPELLGSSGGSLCAVGLVLGLDFDDIAKFALECVGQTHGSLAGAFKLRTYAGACIDRQWSRIAAENRVKNKQRKEQEKCDSLKKSMNDDQTSLDGQEEDDEDENDDYSSMNTSESEDHLHGAEDILAGRVTVSVTTLPWLRNKRYNSFDSMEHVKTVLLASCTATPLAGFPFKLDGEWVIDGGLADFQPLSETLPRRSTVTVSPFYCSHADIRPSRYVPLWWAVYPPRKEDFEWVFALGFDDANTWLATLRQKDAIKASQKVTKSALKTSLTQSLEETIMREKKEEAKRGLSHWWSRSDSMGDLKDTSRFPSDASQGHWTYHPLPALIRNVRVPTAEDLDQLMGQSLSRGSSRTSSACTSATTSASITPNSPLWFGDSHPTMSYASIWPYASDQTVPPHDEAGPGRQPPKYSEYSFRRVFGYRSIFKIIPSGALDMLLVAAVFLVFQPFAFALVYLELFLRIGLLAFVSSWHGVVYTVLSSKQLARKVWDGVIEPVHVLYNLLCEEFSVLQRRWRPMSTHEAEKAAYAAADAAAARAVDASRQRASAKRAKRARRDSRRRLRATIRAVLNPVLLLRMIPVLGKSLTGDAYAMRRSLCELSMVYRVCVHFL